jgi:hypothetical protein
LAVHEIDLALIDGFVFLCPAWITWTIGCERSPNQAADFANTQCAVADRAMEPLKIFVFFPLMFHVSFSCMILWNGGWRGLALLKFLKLIRDTLLYSVVCRPG